MVIFHSYVSLPEGNCFPMVFTGKCIDRTDQLDVIYRCGGEWDISCPYKRQDVVFCFQQQMLGLIHC